MFYRPDIIHVHNLPQLRAGCVLRKVLHIRLIYDAHEIYPEIGTLSSDERQTYLELETEFIRQADQVIAVNPFIADLQAQTYRIAEPAVVLNAAVLPPGFERGMGSDRLKTAIGLTAREKVLLFQGQVTVERGLGILGDLVQSMSLVPENIHLALLGCGEDIPNVAAIAHNYGVSHRVHVLDPVSQDELLFWLASADAGIIPYQAVDRNYFFCSPKELFEFIAAGTPIVANDLPYLRLVVGGEGYGLVRPLVEPNDYAAAICDMFDETIGGSARFKSTVMRTGGRYLWREQAPVLLSIYHSLLRWPEIAAEPSRLPMSDPTGMELPL
jgi:glycosyltransferase involved in cell wall biosynthesis